MSFCYEIVSVEAQAWETAAGRVAVESEAGAFLIWTPPFLEDFHEFHAGAALHKFIVRRYQSRD